MPSKKGKDKKIFLSKIFKEQPVSLQLSLSIKFLIKLAILEDTNLIILSFLLILIPLTNFISSFSK